MDIKLEDQIIMMQVSIDDNKKDTDQQQRKTDAKIVKISKCMGKLMDKFDDTSPKKVKKNPNILPSWSTP